jgi:nitrogenase molybdenum-iron protein alpha/beta subunit
VVGVAECGYYSRYVAVTPYGKNGELHYVYELDSNEVVFGCRKGVKNALVQMDREGARVIVIILTCVPALIGEDMESIIQELESEMEAKVVFIDSAHFKRNGYQSGFSDILEQLVSLTESPISSVIDKKINILGSARGKEFNHFKEILSGNGYEVESHSHGIGMEQLNILAIGRVNIVMNTKMLKAAKMLYKKHRIPYISMADRYTAEDITKGYDEIFDLLQLENTKDIFKGRNILEDFIKGAEKLKGISFIGTYPEFDTLPVTLFLSELGMIPELLHIEEYDENSNCYKRAINQLGQNPYITYITDDRRVLDTFTEDSKFLSLGSCEGLDGDRIVEASELRGMTSLFGYERSAELLNLIMEKLV